MSSITRSTPNSRCRRLSKNRSGGISPRPNGRRSVATEGIEGLSIVTRNYGATAAFWGSMGYKNVYETDHGSGTWEHPNGGPYVFIQEQHDGELQWTPILRVADSTTFSPSREVTYEEHFHPEHWGVM